MRSLFQAMFLCIGLILCVNLLVACAEEEKTVKNRVPTMPSQQVQPAPEPPKKEEPKELTEGRPEHSNMGTITEVIDVHQDTVNSEGWYLGFTFQEEGGFVKRFYPVCGGQTLPTSKLIAIMYHWHPYETPGHNRVGCYIIDGYQTK